MLWFFPISNKLGQQDKMVRHVMRTVLRLARDCEHVKRRVPLTWLRVIDGIKFSNKQWLSYAQALRIAGKAGLPSSVYTGWSVEKELDYVLRLMHNFLFALWNSDKELRDLIVVVSVAIEPF